MGPSFPTRDGFTAMPLRGRSAVARGQIAVKQHILLGAKPHPTTSFWCCISVLPAFFTGVVATFCWLLWGA